MDAIDRCELAAYAYFVAVCRAAVRGEYEDIPGAALVQCRGEDLDVLREEYEDATRSAGLAPGHPLAAYVAEHATSAALSGTLDAALVHLQRRFSPLSACDHVDWLRGVASADEYVTEVAQ